MKFTEKFLGQNSQTLLNINFQVFTEWKIRNYRNNGVIPIKRILKLYGLNPQILVSQLNVGCIY